MYVKQHCLVLLLAFICNALADIDSNGNEAVQSKVQYNSEDVFQLSRTCASDEDCHHLGNCVVGRGGKFCKCKLGTSGDLCEKVDQCVDNPVKCGTLDDVSCVFDIEKEIAVCICDNETKTYVEKEGRCMSPYMKYSECSQYSISYHEIGDKKFCACELGTSGDYCEIIDQCHNKVVDCGVDNNATCTLGWNGKAYCRCDDKTKIFFYDEKICKECDCGLASYGCKFENGTKICNCWREFAMNDGMCEMCDCGWSRGLSKCEFKEGKKVCTCRDGFALSDTKGCVEMCSATKPCFHFGKCVQNVCKCLKGTRGDFCEIINCDNCGYELCFFNITTKEAYCKCEGSLKFDDYSKTCIECDCGHHGKCSLRWRKQYCTCDEGYVEHNGKCKECDCGNKGSCKIGLDGQKSCNCQSGYTEYEGSCKACDCGSNAKCEFNEYGKRVCKCDPGYGMRYERCTPCYCDPGTTCTFDTSNRFSKKKTCDCPKGYADDNGRCRDINECENNPCDDPDAVCVNTPGSYRCECNQLWKTASIIVGVSSAVIIIGLIIALLRSKFRRNNLRESWYPRDGQDISVSYYTKYLEQLSSLPLLKNN